MIELAPFVSSSRVSTGYRLRFEDASEAEISVLAPDLMRFRLSLGKPLGRDRSWAVSRRDWAPVPSELDETAEEFRIAFAGRHVLFDKTSLRMRFEGESSFGPFLHGDAGIAVRRPLGRDEHFYGLGEKASGLDKRRGRFRMWNTDTPGYVEGTDPLYQSIPFFISLERGKAWGLFLDNSHESHFDFAHSTHDVIEIGAAGGELDLYYFFGPTIPAILSRYTELTGRMPMPPMWALGNQQSRWSYASEAEVEEVVRRYREADMPLDVVHLDIDYMDAYRVFTWDRSRFPNPRAFADRLAAKGVKLVAIVDPGVKYEPSATAPYRVYEEGAKHDYFLKREGGELFIGEVWPGKSVFVDYTLPEARRWWGDQHAALLDAGVAGIWNDMNEPADFLDQTGKSQHDVVSDDEGEKTKHARNRNTFALLMARAAREGLERLRPDRRPYLITRAGFAGIQRYSTMWTGDNVATWDGLALSLKMFLGLGLSGESFVGADIGGFQNGNADGELMVRWYQLGFLTPFCRNHRIRGGSDQEPYRYPKGFAEIIKKYLKLRYRLLPYLYTLVEESHRTGAPILRPLVWANQDDPEVVGIDDQFLVGNDILAAPVFRPGQDRRQVYLPRGVWIDFWSYERHRGGKWFQASAPLDRMPFFIREGRVLPMAPEMRFIGERPWDTITLHVYPDENGVAAGEWYEDDGISPNSEFRRTTVKTAMTATAIKVEIAATGNLPVPKREYKVLVARDELGKFEAPTLPATVSLATLSKRQR